MDLFKRAIVGLCLLVAISILSFNPSQAQAQTGDLFFGQEHSYTVIFRGNGEAVVYGKIDFTNTGDNPVRTFSLEIPSVKPSEFMALQSLNPTITSNCPGYPNLSPSDYCPTAYSYPYQKPQTQPYLNSSTEYQKLKYNVTGTVYELQLQQEVQPKQKTSFVFAYVASGYVTKTLGVYKFTYETPKVSARIKSVNVAVDVDSELILKGKRSEVNYATSGLRANFDQALSAGASAQRFASPEFSNAVSQIGASGPVQKSAQNLAPNESLKVNGEYAKSNWNLIWWSIAWKLLLALLIIAVIAWLIRRWHKNRPLVSPSSNADTALQDNTFHFLHPLYTSVGFGATVLILGITYGVYTLLQTGSLGYTDGFVILIAVLITGLFILAAAILPPVLIGVRYGWRAGVSVIANILAWMLVLIVLYSALRISGVWPSSTPSYPYYRY